MEATVIFINDSDMSRKLFEGLWNIIAPKKGQDGHRDLIILEDWASIPKVLQELHEQGRLPLIITDNMLESETGLERLEELRAGHYDAHYPHARNLPCMLHSATHFYTPEALCLFMNVSPMTMPKLKRMIGEIEAAYSQDPHQPYSALQSDITKKFEDIIWTEQHQRQMEQLAQEMQEQKQDVGGYIANDSRNLQALSGRKGPVKSNVERAAQRREWGADLPER